MTTPAPLPTAAITSVLLPDGVWHSITAGTLMLYYNPQFTSLVEGDPPLTVGGLWAQWQDTSSPPVTYGAPVDQVQAVQFTAAPGQ